MKNVFGAETSRRQNVERQTVLALRRIGAKTSRRQNVLAPKHRRQNVGAKTSAPKRYNPTFTSEIFDVKPSGYRVVKVFCCVYFTAVLFCVHLCFLQRFRHGRCIVSHIAAVCDPYTLSTHFLNDAKVQAYTKSIFQFYF